MIVFIKKLVLVQPTADKVAYQTLTPVAVLVASDLQPTADKVAYQTLTPSAVLVASDLTDK